MEGNLMLLFRGSSLHYAAKSIKKSNAGLFGAMLVMNGLN